MSASGPKSTPLAARSWLTRWCHGPTMSLWPDASRIGRPVLSHSGEVRQRPGEIHVVPAGDIQCWNCDAIPRVLVRAAAPEIIEIRMQHHFIPPARGRAGRGGHARERPCIEIGLVLDEKVLQEGDGIERPATHLHHPFGHRQQEDSVQDRLVHEEVGRRARGHECSEVSRSRRSCEPLRLGGVGAPRHADCAVAPVLTRRAIRSCRGRRRDRRRRERTLRRSRSGL